MKRDGRKLDHKTLEEIRRMAVQRVWNGEKPSVVIASYGFSRQMIYRWLREARGKGRGLRTLISRKGTGRPRTLTPKQEQQFFRWINGKDPRQHGFDFGLWTRLIVRKLIADKFGANLGVTAVGKFLAKLGLTPQKPLKRAYERDPVAIEAWKTDVYPAIAKRAKKRGAEIYFWDESGFRADVRARNDMGRARADPNYLCAGHTTVRLGGFSRQCQRRLLVRDLQRRNERGAIY